MGRLAGFRYREVVKRLKRCGFQFDRQAAGSHEICRRESTWMNVSGADGSDGCRPGPDAHHGPTPELMVPLADQPGEIGFCVVTTVKRVEITLRGTPFPHLLAACGGVLKALRAVRLHHGRLIVVLGRDWGCQLLHAYGNGGHGQR